MSSLINAINIESIVNFDADKAFSEKFELKGFKGAIRRFRFDLARRFCPVSIPEIVTTIIKYYDKDFEKKVKDYTKEIREECVPILIENEILKRLLTKVVLHDITQL